MKNKDQLLDDAEASRFLKVEERTLREWRIKRGLPHIRITARVIRYRLSDLHAWMDGLAVNGQEAWRQN